VIPSSTNQGSPPPLVGVPHGVGPANRARWSAKGCKGVQRASGLAVFVPWLPTKNMSQLGLLFPIYGKKIIHCQETMDSYGLPHPPCPKRNDGLPRLDHGGRKIGGVVQDTGDHHFLLLML